MGPRAIETSRRCPYRHTPSSPLAYFALSKKSSHFFTVDKILWSKYGDSAWKTTLVALCE